jgi:quercetin dioxygenase-like cupin family protein
MAALRSDVVVLAVMLAVSVMSYGVVGADDRGDFNFIPELKQREEFGNSDFIFKFEKTADVTPFGNLRPLFVDFNPALATLPGDGAAQNLVTVGPCAINQPHNHPRATQISHVTEGELFFGFAEENGGRNFIGGNATKGQTVIIPQGLIHFAQNLGCKEAQFIASFPHRDPGTQTTASAFFKLPLSAIRATTNLTDDEIKKIMTSVANNPNPSLDVNCAKICGISY